MKSFLHGNVTITEENFVVAPKTLCEKKPVYLMFNKLSDTYYSDFDLPIPRLAFDMNETVVLKSSNPGKRRRTDRAHPAVKTLPS